MPARMSEAQWEGDLKSGKGSMKPGQRRVAGGVFVRYAIR